MAQQLPEPIARRLSALRRSLRAWVLIDGAGRLCVWLALLVLASFAVDRLFRMDEAQRAICLGLAAVALGAVVWRRLYRPLSCVLPDEELCQRVERRHAGLKEALVSAVQFSRMPSAGELGYSPALLRASIDQGAHAASAVDFREALNAQRRNHNLMLLGGVLVLALAVAALFPNVMSLWFRRNVLLSSEAWPHDTHLTVEGLQDGWLALPRGDDLEVRVSADPNGVVPSLVNLEYRVEGDGGSGEEQLVMVGANTFRWTFKNVLKPLRFKVRGGDAATPWIEVRLVERPLIEELVLRATAPTYTGEKPRTLPSSVGSHYLLKGSTLEIQGRANKEIESAQLFFGKEKLGAATLSDARTVKVLLEPGKLSTGTYALALKDRLGLSQRNPTRFTIRVVGDRKPVVRAVLEGVGEMITTRACVPIRAKMSDDFAVVKTDLCHRKSVPGEATEEAEFARSDIKDLEGRYGEKEIEHLHRLEVEPLGIELGSHLLFYLQATDNDVVSGPNIGRSGTFALKVVSDGELRNELVRREQEQRQEFVRLLNDQKELRDGAVAVLEALRKTSPEKAKSEPMLKKEEKRQRLMTGRCEGIAEQFAGVLAELVNNRLEERDGPAHARLQVGVVVPLKNLARGPIPRAADALRRAGTASLDLGARAKALEDAMLEQDRILDSMRKILQNMVKFEGYQEAVTLLREILDGQRNVNEATIKEKQKKIEKIFDD